MFKTLIILLFTITIMNANVESDKNKEEVISNLKEFKKDISPYVSKDLINILGDLESEIKKEKNLNKIDLLTLFYLDFKFQIINN